MTSTLSFLAGRTDCQSPHKRREGVPRRPHQDCERCRPCRRVLAGGVMVLLLFWAQATAVRAQGVQPPELAPQSQLSDVEKKFDETVRVFEKYLYDAGAFAVDVRSDWTSSGSGKASQGTNVFHLAVQKGNKFRIEAGSKEKGEAQFVCACDGRHIVRLSRPAKYYSQHEASPNQDDLQHDAMTLQTVSGSGVELLIHPQMRADLIAQIDAIKPVGTEKLDGQEVVHVQLAMKDKRQFDVWFQTGDKPMLVKLATTLTIPIDDQRTFRLVTTSSFQWKVGGPLKEETFAVEIPPDAIRVDDLLSALQDGDIRQLLGKPAPPLELTDLTGKAVRLADYLGKKVVVLIFWASWCAPSTNDMDTLNAFVAEAEGNGAVVLAINLGEESSLVKTTIDEHKYRGKVLLDPHSKSLDVYRFGAIPMTLLIGKDGTVQSFHSGSTPEARKSIRQDAAALLGGKQLTAPGGQ